MSTVPKQLPVGWHNDAVSDEGRVKGSISTSKFRGSIWLRIRTIMVVMPISFWICCSAITTNAILHRCCEILYAAKISNHIVKPRHLHRIVCKDAGVPYYNCSVISLPSLNRKTNCSSAYTVTWSTNSCHSFSSKTMGRSSSSRSSNINPPIRIASASRSSR